MSIASEITRLQQAKSDLATSIAAKGVTVPAATTIDGYAALVDQIQQGGTPVFPYDAEIQYIESTGTQYIETGIYANSTLTLKMEFTIVDGFTFGNAVFLFGTYSSGCLYSVALPSLSNIRVPTTKGGFVNISVSLDYTSSHIISYRPGEIYVDDVKKGNQSDSFTSTGVPIRIFGRNSDTDSNKTITGKLRVHKVIAFNSIGEVQYLIPVRIGQVGYLYDKVSGTLLGNQGTGSFILGPDIT